LDQSDPNPTKNVLEKPKLKVWSGSKPRLDYVI